MPEEKQPVSPKVHAAAWGAAVSGMTIGKACAHLFMKYALQDNDPVTELAVETIFQGGAALAGGYLTGYYKSA